MTDYKTILIPFDNGGHVKLLFKKFSPMTEWVCEMSDDFMELIENEIDYDPSETH